MRMSPTDTGSSLPRPRPLRRRAVRTYLSMFRHWHGLLSGKGYWHAPQGVGRYFVPGELEGYFNDLTAKTRWIGPVDQNGILLNRLDSGDYVYFPTAVFQKGLGHWDLWIASKQTSEHHRAAFLAVADWAVERQDPEGGWTSWSQLGLSRPSPYSAMTQGQALSILVRAHRTTLDSRYLDAADRALNLLLRSGAGGVAVVTDDGLVLEEIRNDEGATVLNGWLFGLFGLYDYTLTVRSDSATTALCETVSALVARLPLYQGSYWSFYDTRRNLASPFYHRLHIAQLRAFEAAFPERAIAVRPVRERFERQDARFNRLLAIGIKAAQKLKDPPEVILR
jgi:hypothetical protein